MRVWLDGGRGQVLSRKGRRSLYGRAYSKNPPFQVPIISQAITAWVQTTPPVLQQPQGGTLMSVQAMSWVIEHSRHKGAELLCLLMIANHAHADGTNAFPSIETLARECRMSERQIKRIIQKLEESGELRVERGVGRGNVNYYVIVMDGEQSHTSQDEAQKVTPMSPFPEDEEQEHEEKVTPVSPFPEDESREKVTSGDEKGDKMSPFSGEKVTSEAKKGDIAMSPEPSLTVNSNIPIGADAPIGPAPKPLVDQFQELLRQLRNAKPRDRPVILRRVYSLCFGEASAPDYGYLGKVARQVGGAGRLAQLLWQLSANPPSGDVLAYILAMERNRRRRDERKATGICRVNGNGHDAHDAGEMGQPPGPSLEEIQRRQLAQLKKRFPDMDLPGL